MKRFFGSLALAGLLAATCLAMAACNGGTPAVQPQADASSQAAGQTAAAPPQDTGLPEMVEALGLPYLGGQESTSYVGYEAYITFMQRAQFPEGYTGYMAADFDGDGEEELLLTALNAAGGLELRLYTMEGEALALADTVVPGYAYEGTDMVDNFQHARYDVFTFDVFTSEDEAGTHIFYEMWFTSNYLFDGVMWQLVCYDVVDNQFVLADELRGGGSDSSSSTSFETGDLDGPLTEYLKPMAEKMHSYGFVFGSMGDGNMVADQNAVRHVSRIQSQSAYTWESMTAFFDQNGHGAVAEAATVAIHNLLGLPVEELGGFGGYEAEVVLEEFAWFTVTGRLATLHYEINHQNTGTVDVLYLSEPITVLCDYGDGTPVEVTLDAFQLGGLANAEQYYGQVITVAGEVMFAHTGHHQTPVVLMEAEIR